MKIRNKLKRATKFEIREQKRQKFAQATQGDGLYLFVNNTRGDLILPKPVVNNGVIKKIIAPGATFEGNSYYFCLMKTGQVRQVKVLQEPIKVERKDMVEEKLILNQPDRFTPEGKIEQVVPVKKEPLNESKPDGTKNPIDTLITEDPMSGVEIIFG